MINAIAPSMSAWIEGIGLLGPGIADWAQGAAILANRCAYTPTKTLLTAPAALPPNERRRAVPVVRLSLTTGFEAVAHAQRDASSLATVFSSSGGDGQNLHAICEMLASSDRQISPTRFHNSVHNAAAGYWGIAAHATPPSTALCAFDGSFGAGLLEALAWISVEKTPILLLVYDLDYPEPLRQLRPVPDAFGVALVLTPTRTERALTQITAQLCSDAATIMPQAELELMRQAIPAARCLPLLALIAQCASGRAVLDYLDDCRLAIEVAP
jgi:Beta-ketoacyl synthase, N-terminal domain